jgi:hypothetical protein
VFGIAARNGILMISHFQHLEQEEGEAFGPSLVLRGAKERLAPILMTASATGLALVPLAVAGSIAGHEIEHPMAIVILGGLVTSTLLNLFVLPSLYLRFGKSRREHFRSRHEASEGEPPSQENGHRYVALWRCDRLALLDDGLPERNRATLVVARSKHTFLVQSPPKASGSAKRGVVIQYARWGCSMGLREVSRPHATNRPVCHKMWQDDVG